MPKIEAKVIQKELEAGKVWPLYWIYGPERMKSRELVKRIRRTVLGAECETPGYTTFLEETLDGGEVSAEAVVDSARMMSLGGGTRLVLVREAHLLKEPDALAELFGPVTAVQEAPCVTVLVSKELDGRRKFSKALTEKAAVVECAEIGEPDREAWIQYLSKRRGLQLTERVAAGLRYLDPWSLDIIDQELEKIELRGPLGEGEDESGASPLPGPTGSDVFFEALFARDAQKSLELVSGFADHPDESLPLVGLLTWNLRQLGLTLADRDKGTRSVKLPPFLTDRFRRWARGWTLPEVVALQERLQRLDFSLKQTPRLPLGLWGELVMEFCRPRAP